MLTETLVLIGALSRAVPGTCANALEGAALEKLWRALGGSPAGVAGGKLSGVLAGVPLEAAAAFADCACSSTSCFQSACKPAPGVAITPLSCAVRVFGTKIMCMLSLSSGVGACGSC